MHRRLCAFSVLVALAALPGCVHPHHPRGHRSPAPPAVHEPGPPPHAPAHGYRHKHRENGAELAFDSRLGLYAVVGWEDHFFSEGHFYRLVDSIWQVSVRIDGGWVTARSTALPKGLAAKPAKARARGKSKRAHPAKHR